MDRTSFAFLLQHTLVARGIPVPPRLVTFDPGGTTGVAYFLNGEPVVTDQVAGTIPSVAASLRKVYTPEAVHPDWEPGVDVVALENFRIYAWKTEDMKWKDILELRLIGALELVCADNATPLLKIGAGQGKGFTTNKKLQTWNFIRPLGQKHANDAIRVGCYILLQGIPTAVSKREMKVTWE